MSSKVVVDTIPSCDLCKLRNVFDEKAYADAYIPTLATWGYVCKQHFAMNGCQLGTGKGQELVLNVYQPRNEISDRFEPR